MWIEFLLRLANETLSAISFIHPAHAVHRSPVPILSTTPLAIFSRRLTTLITLTVGDYEDSRDDGWQREVNDDRRRQYDDRRRQFEDRRRQLDDRQRQLDQERRQLEDEERRMEDEYGR